MEEDSSPTEKRKHQKGGKILRYEPSNCSEITSSPFIRKFFEYFNYLVFFQRVEEVGFHE